MNYKFLGSGTLLLGNYLDMTQLHCKLLTYRAHFHTEALTKQGGREGIMTYTNAISGEQI